MKKITPLVLLFLSCLISYGKNSPQPTGGRSVYQNKLEDPDAVYFTPANFKITADGKTDVSDELQRAITEIKTKYNFGILFIPEGKYLISKTIYVPMAVRLIGYGKNRPQIILAKNSPGYQAADERDKGKAKYMLWFVSRLSKPGESVQDASAGTFYSAISNINLKIEDDNPYAVALRAHFAQHSFIAHADIDIGNGKAGLFDVGNAMEDVRFFGGQYGIYTTKPSPGWQFMMVDTYFEGQRIAAIRTQEAGLTIVRLHAKNVPSVIDIDPNYHEKLFMENCRFDKVTGPAIMISNEDNAVNQISLHNIDCRDVPVFAGYRRTGKQTVGAGAIYKVKNFIYGLQMDSLKADPVYKTILDMQPLAALPAPAKKDIPELPAISTWVNLRSLGAKGDGTTDDSQVLQNAIDKYETIYIPQGWYRVSETIKLKPTTVLIGLSPIATQLVLADNTPAFGGFGGPKALLETAKGGRNIVTGIGLSTSADNPRAVACKWMSGENSYLNDVKFIGGHGGMQRPVKQPPATPAPGIYNRGYNGVDPAWDTQYWSLWITNGGGGTFMDIWTANTYATAGAYISNTSTPSHIYALSVEHHVRNEIRFNNVANFNVYALQLEEENRESTECQPMELENCSNMVFANLYMFRVIRVIKPYANSIRSWGNKNIEFLNVHNYSQIKYTTTNPLYDVNSDTEVRPWEFARLFIGDRDSAPQVNGSITKLAGGFEFAEGSCTDSKGNIYFCESRLRRIYKWGAATRTTTLFADYHWEPLSLACDKNDDLLVMFKYVPKPGYLVNGKPEEFKNPPDAAGTSFSAWGNSGFGTLVYSVDPNNPDETIQMLKKVPMGRINPVYKALYPAHRWRDHHDFNTITAARDSECFVAPDGVTIIPVAYDLARSSALAAAWPGKPVYIADEYDKRTVSMQVSSEGYVSDLKYFAERGEFDSITDSAGNVYIADGQVYVYDSSGKQIRVIKVPERPTSLTFDKDGKMLYITAHNALYEAKMGTGLR